MTIDKFIIDTICNLKKEQSVKEDSWYKFSAYVQLENGTLNVVSPALFLVNSIESVFEDTKQLEKEE